MAPGRFQAWLERIYDLRNLYRVEDFLLTDPRLARALGARPGNPEQLLVREGGEDLEVSLFLDSRLLERVQAPAPGIDDLSAVLEGVSHFLLTVWRAAHDRSVRPLELELQAEVDKFLLLSWILPDMDPGRLHRQLFDRWRLRPGLSPEMGERYRTASRLAARLCQRWLRRHPLAPDNPALLSRLRRFYRLALGGKLAEIGG